MKGYKAFDKEMKCRDKQYEVGKTYEENEAILCEKGIHFCENPLDVLNYYNVCESRFAEIEADNVSDEKSKDSKRVAKKVKIETELSLKGFINTAFKFLFEKTENDNDVQAASGDYSQLAASGDYSQLAASGDGSKCDVSGKNSIACSIGTNGRAMGALGCWLVLSEFDDKGNIICVKSAKVDGKKIKADVWYMLKNKKFIEL
jgi:hypothetical protein